MDAILPILSFPPHSGRLDSFLFGKSWTIVCLETKHEIMKMLVGPQTNKPNNDVVNQFVWHQNWKQVPKIVAGKVCSWSFPKGSIKPVLDKKYPAQTRTLPKTPSTSFHQEVMIATIDNILTIVI